MDICHYDPWPGQVVPVADALDRSIFGCEPCCHMEVADSSFNTGEIVEVVNCFL